MTYAQDYQVKRHCLQVRKTKPFLSVLNYYPTASTKQELEHISTAQEANHKDLDRILFTAGHIMSLRIRIWAKSSADSLGS